MRVAWTGPLAKVLLGVALLVAAGAWFAAELRFLVQAPVRVQRELVGEAFTRPLDLRSQYSFYDMQGAGTESWTFALRPASEARLRDLCTGLAGDPAAAARRRLDVDVGPGQCTLRRRPPGGRVERGRTVTIEHLRDARRVRVSHFWN